MAEFVLAWRAVGLGLVYLWNPTIRAQALDLPDLCRRAWRRLARAATGSGSGSGPVRGERARQLVPRARGGAVRVISAPKNSDFAADSTETSRLNGFLADRDIQRMGSMASERLFELDFARADRDAPPAPEARLGVQKRAALCNKQERSTTSFE